MIPCSLQCARPEPANDVAKHWSIDRVRDDMKASVAVERLRLAQPTRDVRAPRLWGLDSTSYDLRPYSSPRHDQRRTSSCVANAWVKVLEILRIIQHGRDAHIDLSRDALYWLLRELHIPPETDVDQGGLISLGADAARIFGVCPEASWPFDEKNLFTAPSWMAMRKAYLHKITASYRIDSFGADRVDDFILNLAAKNPPIAGFTVGQSWFDYKVGDVLGPVADADVLGRHAVVIVGWDAQRSAFIIESSWGDTWGDNGFALIAPEVVADPTTADCYFASKGYEDWAQAACSRSSSSLSW